MLKSNLLIGSHIDNLSEQVLAILTNKEAIVILQTNKKQCEPNIRGLNEQFGVLSFDLKIGFCATCYPYTQILRSRSLHAGQNIRKLEC